MKKTICSAMIAMTLPWVSFANTVFNDTFSSGSTVQSASPANPTATSTAYEDFQQGTAPVATIASGVLHLQGRNTSQAVTEIQALFATTPVVLATSGDYVELTVVFTNTANVMTSGAVGASLNIGLYNSAGVKPNQGARLDSASPLLSGGSQNWDGYVGRILGNGAARVYTRPPQTTNGTTAQNQDLLFNGVSGSSTYNLPAGAIVGSANTTLTNGLTQGEVYTMDFRITLSDVGTLTISNALYSGSSVNAANTLFNQLETTNSATGLVVSFDGLAFGWRFNSTAAANAIDITRITVNTSVSSGSSVPPFNITAIKLLPPDGVKLTWDSVSGTNYQIQSTDSLNPISWTTNGTVTATGVSTSFTNSPVLGSVTQRFYRAVATP